MRRLTRDEIKECRDYLTAWRTLDEVNSFMVKISSVSELYAVSQGGLKFWREAWIGMSCAYLTHALRFRLGEDPPDIYLDYGTHEQGFEIVQALPEGMKVSGDHDKYADELSTRGQTIIKTRSFKQKERDLQELPKDLRIQIASKAGKNYPKGCILLYSVHVRTRKLRTSETPLISGSTRQPIFGFSRGRSIVDILHEIFLETDTGPVLGIAKVAKEFLRG